MSLVIRDRVRQKAYPLGTGNINLGVAVDSYFTFEQVGLSSNQFPYLILAGEIFEVGIGSYITAAASGTPHGVLVRSLVLTNSSLNTNFINFQGVLGDVLMTNAAELSVLVSSQPVVNTRKIIKWMDSEYQLLDPVENATALGSGINSSIMYYNSTTTNYNADENLKFYPGALPELYINGVIQATAKSFKIKHPTKSNLSLVHGCLEGPEHGIYFRGVLTTRYKTSIEIPDYFTALGNNFSLNITSNSYMPFKYSMANQKIEVKMLLPTIKSVNFSFILFATRTDVLLKMEV